MLKSAVEPINSNKNKLNSKIIFIFHPNPNADLVIEFIHPGKKKVPRNSLI